MSDTSTTAAHADKSTLTISVNVLAHPVRKTSPTFERTRPQLIAREQDRCWICGRTSTEVGAGHEAHHSYLEWCLAPAADWAIIQAMCEAGEWGWTNEQRAAAKAFVWTGFDPADPEAFVDNMLVNGMLLCKEHHTGAGTGMHMMDNPRHIFQKFKRDDVDYIENDVEGNESERLTEIHAEDQSPTSELVNVN